MKQLTALCLLCCCLFSNSYSQLSKVYTGDYADFQEAVSFYNNKQYSLSKQLFEGIKNHTESENIKDKCEWYIASSSIKIGGNDSEKPMLKFASSFVANSNLTTAYYELGVYYFLNNDFKKSLMWLKRIETKSEYNQDDDFKFKIGYCYFSQQKYFDARKYLMPLSDNPIYGIKVNYYLGFIAFKSNNYAKAKTYFDKIKDENFAGERVSYYQSFIYFVTGKYQKAISSSVDVLRNATKEEEIIQLNKIIGESYFKLGKYRESIPYLKSYQGKWKNSDYYQLGYAHYQEKDYHQATECFNKIMNEKSELSQNAYYHLGKSYFKIGDKVKALTAFTRASQLDFNKEIQKDAWFNRAKLSYQIGNLYQSSIIVLDSFIKKYPNSNNRIQINKLLTNALTSSKDYDKALELISKNNTYKNRSTYQKLNYIKGASLYKEKLYNKAISFLKKSTQEPIDSLYYIRAKYLIGDSYYLKKDYHSALLEWRDLQLVARGIDFYLIDPLNYDIAYCYYKTRNFEKALEYFKRFINESKPSEKVSDALNRIADCYTTQGKYKAAIENYQASISMNSDDIDYSVFKKAVLEQYTNPSEKSELFIEQFIKLYPKSSYVDDAYMNIAQIQSKKKQYIKAISTYETLKSKFPYSILYPKSLINQAQLYEEINDYESAIKSYKTVISEFPKTQESLESVGLLKALYIKINDLESYASWIRQINFNQTDDYTDQIRLFNLSKNDYLKLNQIEGLEDYLSLYPKGIHSAEAAYLIADYAQNSYDQSAYVKYLTKVTETPNRFNRNALYKLSNYYLENEDYSNALVYLGRLSNESKNSYDTKFSYLKIAEIQYLFGKYNDAEETLKKAFEINSDTELDGTIKLLFSKIYIETDRIDQAINYLTSLNNIPDEKIRSQVYYYKAFCLRIKQNFEESNQNIIKLTKNHFNQRLLCAKALLLLASNYADMKDYFQASSILENVTSQYKDFSNIVEEAQSLLNQLNN